MPLASPSVGLSLLLHTGGLASFLASFKYLATGEQNQLAQAYGGYLQFLTILALALSTLTFAAGIAADVTASRRLFSVKNGLSVVTTPIEVLVAAMYWPIYAYDSSLLFPPDFMLPLVPDIGFHAMPGLLLGLDALLFSPPWTIGAIPMLALSNVLAFVYWAWVEHCYSHNGW